MVGRKTCSYYTHDSDDGSWAVQHLYGDKQRVQVRPNTAAVLRIHRTPGNGNRWRSY